MTRRLALTPLLAGINLLLALLLAALWLAPGPVARWRAWQAPAPQPPNLDDVQAALIAANPAAATDYPAVLERPLLLSTRRPEAPASAAASAPAPAAIEQVKLTGIVSGPTLSGVLLEEGGQSRFVRQGEKVGDWTLSAIDGRTLTFTRGAERKQIDLPYANLAGDQGGGKNSSGKAAPGAAAPPPQSMPTPPQATPPPRPTPAAAPPPAPAAREGGAAAAPPVAAFGGSVAPARPPAKGGKP